MFSRKIILVAVTFLSVSNVFSLEDVSSSAHTNITAAEANQTNDYNAMDRAMHAALNIREFLLNYTMTNKTDPTSKKAAQQDTASSLLPAELHGYIPEANSLAGLNDIRQLVPYLVENVVSPLIKRVFLRENLHTLYSWYYSSTPTPVAGNPVASEAESNGDGVSTTKKPASPKPPVRRRRRKTTTTQPTTEIANVSRSGLEDGLTTTTLAPAKTKYTVISRRPKSTTTKKPSEDENQDDEDESEFLNKIKLLH